MSSSHMHDSFEQVHFSELVKSIHQIELNGQKQFTAQAAQIYKLLNQNILWGAWQSLWLKMSITAVYLILWGMNWFNTTVTELSKQFDSDRRPMSRWYVHAWTKRLNEGVKWMFIWFLVVYVKRWADEDYFIHFVCFRHAKHRRFT